MRLARLLALVALVLATLPARGEEASSQDKEPLVKQQGQASYYGGKFQGKKTANGETFNENKLTAASPDLPLGTRATVTNEENGKSVDVKINDRGPYVDGRIIDLSKRAAGKLDMKKQGVAPVTVEARPSSQPTKELEQALKEKAQEQAGK
jgi:rare lipoprotein A